MMRDLIKIEDAVGILELMLLGRLESGERARIEGLLSDLRLALVDPETCELLHLPVEERRALGVQA